MRGGWARRWCCSSNSPSPPPCLPRLGTLTVQTLALHRCWWLPCEWVIIMWSVKLFCLPSCQDANHIHNKSSLHHVWCFHSAGTKHNGVRCSRYGEHEGIAAGDRCCQGEVDGVRAEGLGHLWEDGNQDVGCSSVGSDLCHHCCTQGNYKTNQQNWKILKIFQK